MTAGQRAAFVVAGFLATLLPLNTYWALGGTWGVAWVLGCAGCTVPLAFVWVQEALVVAGIGVVLARLGQVRLLFAPLALSLSVLSAVANRRLPSWGNADERVIDAEGAPS